MFGNEPDELFSSAYAQLLASEDESRISEHSFLQYRTQILAVGAVPVIVKEATNKISINSMLKAVTHKTKLFVVVVGVGVGVDVVTAPTNPTNTLLTSREITLLRRTLSAKTVLVLDITYTEC